MVINISKHRIKQLSSEHQTVEGCKNVNSHCKQCASVNKNLIFIQLELLAPITHKLVAGGGQGWIGIGTVAANMTMMFASVAIFILFILFYTETYSICRH